MSRHTRARRPFREAPNGAEALAMDVRLFANHRPGAGGEFDVPAELVVVPEERDGGVAVLSISGPLEHHASWMWTSYEEIAEQLEAACAAPEVHSVVLKIDSPGGIAAGMGEMHKRICALRAEHGKPIYAFVDEMACSAAYHLASACNEIWLPEAGQVGSVGVILCTVDETGALEKQGVKVRYVVTGARKADLHPGQPVTDDVIGVAQEKVDYLGGLFFAAVATARGMTPAAVEALQAAVFSGEEAVSAGLADGVSGWQEFMTYVIGAAGAGGSVPMAGTKGGTPPKMCATVRHTARHRSIAVQKEQPAMAKLLVLQKAVADARAEVDAARKAFAKAPNDSKAMKCLEKALTSKLSAQSALDAASAKVTTTKHIKHEEKVTEREEDEDEEAAEEEEAEAASDAGSDASSTGASSTDGSDSDSDDEAEEEKALAAAFHGATKAGLHTPDRLLRLARQVTGQKSIKSVFGALDGIGKRLASVEKTEKRLAKLETESRAMKVDGMLASALTDGKITKAQVPDLRAKGMQDRGFLKGFLATLPKLHRTIVDGELVPRSDADGNPIGGPSKEQQDTEARLVQGKSAAEAERLIADFRKRLTSNGAASPKH